VPGIIHIVGQGLLPNFSFLTTDVSIAPSEHSYDDDDDVDVLQTEVMARMLPVQPPRRRLIEVFNADDSTRATLNVGTSTSILDALGMT